MNIFQAIARALTRQTPIDELDTELRMRTPRVIDRHERSKKKTKSGAEHKHREPGDGLHRRVYIPGCNVAGRRRAARA